MIKYHTDGKINQKPKILCKSMSAHACQVCMKSLRSSKEMNECSFNE